MAYDPVKAHEYYERTKKLKGRKKVRDLPSSRSTKSKAKLLSKPKSSSDPQFEQARVSRLTAAVTKLKTALSRAEAELVKKRAAEKETAKKNSDGKSTASEKRASQEYRDKHKQEIASKQKSSSGSSSSTSSRSLSDLSVDELETRIIKIRSTLKDAQQQLSNATLKHGELMHTALTSELSFNDNYARFRSAERIPSKW